MVYFKKCPEFSLDKFAVITVIASASYGVSKPSTPGIMWFAT
jgi:hypothetical protein